MTAVTSQYSRAKYEPLLWTYAVLLSLSLIGILRVQDEIQRVALVDIFAVIIGVLSTAVLFYTTWKLRTTNRKVALAWFFIALSCLVWAMADTTWAVLELILHEEPFPSIADLFYLLYYPLAILGFTFMPAKVLTTSERIKNSLDLSIVFLAATMIYWYFMIGPLVVFEDTDLATVLISVAYPVFDLVLFAGLMVLLYSKQSVLTLPALLFISVSIFTQIIGDAIYGLQSISGVYASGTLLDYTWQVGIALFGLAGVVQLMTIHAGDKTEPSKYDPIIRTYLNSILTFTPYAWLVAAYALLVYTQFTLLPMSEQWIAIGIGIMLALVLIRQVVAISETTRLSKQLKAELIAREHAEDLLRQTNADLEERVVRRTNDLTAANTKLSKEVNERCIAEAQLEQSLHEKEILLKEIHHRVKNNLQIISSMLALQVSQTKEPYIANTLMDSQNRVQSMALIHDKLYQSEDLAKVDFAQYLQSLLAYLSRSFQSRQKDISVNIEAVPITLEITQAVPCALIVNELITNAYKHAYPDNTAGQITVQVCSPQEGIMQLIVSDGGVGMPANFNIAESTSLGLQMVNALVDQVDGKLEYENHNGSRFTITLPTEPLEYSKL